MAKAAKGKYGYFDTEKREYVITRPDTPRPWFNYMMNDSFVSMISNTGGGVAFDTDPTRFRLLRYRMHNVPYDRPGRYIYIRDRESGKYWSSTWAPTHHSIKNIKYRCRVGMGYQIVTSEYDGIRTEVKYFVPQDRKLELWDFAVTNIGRKSRKISTYSYAEFAFWGSMRDIMNIDNCPNISRQGYKKQHFIHSSFNDVGTGLDDMNFIRFYGYHTCNRKPSGYTGDRDYFIGMYRDEKNPKVVEEGKSANYCENGGYPIGSFEHRFNLKPGESKRIVFQTGYAEDEKSIFRDSKKYTNPAKVDKAFAGVVALWKKRLDCFKVRTPDTDFDTCVNTFIQYQSSVTMRLSRMISPFYWGASVGMGFRDSCQDQMGMMHAIPEEASRKINDLLGAVFPNGDVAHSSQPAIDRYESPTFYDDRNWLALTVCQYIKESGDLDILNRKFKYCDSGKSGTALEHLLKCNDRAWQLRGKNGLLQTGSADWNDSLNPGDLKTESLFNSTLYCASTKELVGLLEHIGDKRNAAKYRKRYETISKLINTKGWDGEWVKRLIFTDGSVCGSKTSVGLPKIFLEPQPWAVIGGAVTGRKAEKMLDAVEKHLGTPDGHKVMNPAFDFDYYEPKIGSVTVVLPGIKENGAVFNHAASWMIAAEASIGRGGKAMEYFKRLCAATKNRNADRHEVEPYIACQFVSQKPYHIVGRGRNPWLSGTAAWMAVGSMQYILGCRPDYAGLRIDPAIPANWKGFEIERVFRGTSYAIKVKNPKGVEKGVAYVEVDGKKYEGNVIPYIKSKNTVNVTVYMG